MFRKNIFTYLWLALLTLSLSSCKIEETEEPQEAVSQTKIIQQANASLEQKRQDYQKIFTQAYQLYPELPQGILESLAYVATRWEHRMPVDEEHQGMPQTYGIFGLYDTDKSSFRNTLQMVADMYGVDKTVLLEDVESYILATASFIQFQILDKNLQGKTIENYRPIYANLSGIEKNGNINEYAINSFVFDALNILEKGHDDNGIKIQHQKIQWEKAFNKSEMKMLKASGLLIDPKTGVITLKDEIFAIGQSNKNLSEEESKASSIDYPSASWVASPNYSNRGQSISHVTIHTMQGSYSGSISWFLNPSSNASAHYMVRSSDGQVTQMVRESKKAWHARSANPYTIGIEHEGYVSNPAWYTESLYNSSADITMHICDTYNVDCSQAYSGSASSSVNPISQSYTVKGHQHFPDQTHTDPGVYWDWSKYAGLVSGASSPVTTILDSFEASEGHFTNYPTYSGSTQGISSASTAVRVTSIAKNGIGSEQIRLVDNSSSSQDWAVRFLSGGGSPSKNVKFQVQNGRVGFWVRSGGSGMSAAVSIDDGSGTEKSISRSIPTGQWVFLEWNLDDSSQWNPWVGSSNGQLDAANVTIDAIWFHRAQTSYDVYLNIDDVQYIRD